MSDAVYAALVASILVWGEGSGQKFDSHTRVQAWRSFGMVLRLGVGFGKESDFLDRGIEVQGSKASFLFSQDS